MRLLVRSVVRSTGTAGCVSLRGGVHMAKRPAGWGLGALIADGGGERGRPSVDDGRGVGGWFVVVSGRSFGLVELRGDPGVKRGFGDSDGSADPDAGQSGETVGSEEAGGFFVGGGSADVEKLRGFVDSEHGG